MTPSIVCIGELLWDLLPSGPQLGGAPSNLACHVGALGGKAWLVSRIGMDDLGRQARTDLSARGLELGLLQSDPMHPTGTVTVDLDSSGHPRFDIQRDVAWDWIEATPEALDAVRISDAVCFGTLAQRSEASRNAIRSLLASASTPWILCDINLRDPFHTPEILEESLQAATALKLNETELPVLARQFGFSTQPERCMEALAARFQLNTVLLTLGASGSCAWCDGIWAVEDGRSVTVCDTVGAGDSFTAAFLLARLRDWPLSHALRSASEIAAHVCTQPGATPSLPPELTSPFLAPGVHR